MGARWLGGPEFSEGHVTGVRVTHLAVVIQDSGRSSLGCSRKVSQPPADVDSPLSVANSGVISWSTCDILGPVFLEHVKAAACCRPERNLPGFLENIYVARHIRGELDGSDWAVAVSIHFC